MASPPRPPLLTWTSPSTGARTGVPSAAKMSTPSCTRQVPSSSCRGIHQSSDQRARPATGKRPNPTSACCVSFKPYWPSGASAAARASVLLGAVRRTEFTLATMAAGTAPPEGESPPPSGPGATGVVGVVAGPWLGGAVVDVVVVEATGTSAASAPAAATTTKVIATATTTPTARRRDPCLYIWGTDFA